MIIINLLSPSQKKELKTKRVYIATKEIVMLVLLFTSIIAIMLLSSKYILDNRLAKLIERNANTIEENREVISRISTLNSKIDIIDKIQGNFKRWSFFLATITASTPENISYEMVKINYENASLELKGVAKTREDLTKLKTSLENIEFLENVFLPLKNLLPKENNNFNITANIILEKIE